MSTLLSSIATLAATVPVQSSGPQAKRRAMWRASGLLAEADRALVTADAQIEIADDISTSAADEARFHSRAGNRIAEALGKAREAVAILEKMEVAP